MSVKRYSTGGVFGVHIVMDRVGDYVKFEDYERLREAIAEHRTKALDHFPVSFEYDIDLWALVEPVKEVE